MLSILKSKTEKLVSATENINSFVILDFVICLSKNRFFCLNKQRSKEMQITLIVANYT